MDPILNELVVISAVIDNKLNAASKKYIPVPIIVNL